MDALLLIARLSLAVIFGLAGFGKFADPDGSRSAMVELGLPDWLAAFAARLLPWAELIIAVSLMPLQTAWWAALAALLLLLVFTAVISVNLAKGNSPECHCFGQFHSAPLSGKHILRNLGMAALAFMILVQGRDKVGASGFAWLAELRPAEAVFLVLSLITASFVFATLNAVKRLSEEVVALKRLIIEDDEELVPEDDIAEGQPATAQKGLPVGAPAPDFRLDSLAGNAVSLSDLLSHGHQVLLLFISPQCGPCRALLPQVRSWQRNFSEQLIVAIISRGTAAEVADKLDKYELSHLLLQGEQTTGDDYRARWTPAAVLLNSQGRIAQEMATGETAIRALMTAALRDQDQHQKSRRLPWEIGERAPSFSLPNLQGEMVELHSLLNGETLLLFWRPGCGFCQRMIAALQHWEAKPNLPAALMPETKLLFISAGDLDEVRAGSIGFHAPFLHDAENDIAMLFGVHGTPAGFLLDAEGRIASSLAKGERELLALLKKF